MKSITILYNQNQPQRKSNGDEAVPDSAAKEKNGSRLNKKIEQKKAAGQSSPVKEEDALSVQERIGMIIHEIRNPLTAISLANQSFVKRSGTTTCPCRSTYSLISCLKISTGLKPC